jgi:hypothetical protein
MGLAGRGVIVGKPRSVFGPPGTFPILDSRNSFHFCHFSDKYLPWINQPKMLKPRLTLNRVEINPVRDPDAPRHGWFPALPGLHDPTRGTVYL